MSVLEPKALHPAEASCDCLFLLCFLYLHRNSTRPIESTRVSSGLRSRTDSLSFLCLVFDRNVSLSPWLTVAACLKSALTMIYVHRRFLLFRTLIESMAYRTTLPSSFRYHQWHHQILQQNINRRNDVRSIARGPPCHHLPGDNLLSVVKSKQ